MNVTNPKSRATFKNWLMITIQTDGPEEKTLKMLCRTFQEWKEISRREIRILRVKMQGELW